MIFVDTGAWYALAIPSDPDHERAKTFVASSAEPLVTSDYVVDELLTLFLVRGRKRQGILWQQDVLAAGGLRLIHVDHEDFAQALGVYEHFSDKSWSFTDCTSYVLMRKWSITTAFAFDEHFHQFGTITVLPSS